VWKA